MKVAKDCERHKYDVGQLVWVSIRSRAPFRTRILERVEGRPSHYKVDWAVGGFNVLLNTVAVCESALLLHEPTPCA